MELNAGLKGGATVDWCNALQPTAACLFLLLCVLLTSPLSAKEPPVPPGLGAPGGVMVALLGPGIDYRLPELKGHLARDGEGNLIAWDFSDGDNKPFEDGGRGTELARSISQFAPMTQFVVAKERPDDPQALGHMMTFVANTPARIVLWLDANPKRPDWPILAQAIKRFSDRLFILIHPPYRDQLHAYQSVRATNVLLVSGIGVMEEFKGSAKLTDLSIGLPASTSMGGSEGFNHLAVNSMDLVVRAMVAAPALNIAELKRYVIAAQPKGMASLPGFYAPPGLLRYFNGAKP